MIKIKLFILILLILSTGCRFDRVYHNRTFRYKIKYPDGWIAINSGHNKEAENAFKERLQKESPVKNYERVDAAFYNPDSEPPIFEQITITSQQALFNLNRLEELMPNLEDSFKIELSKNYSRVQLINSKVEDFKRGKILRFEFFFVFNSKEYFAVYIIIPGKLFATYYLNGISESKNRVSFLNTFNTVLNTFTKY